MATRAIHSAAPTTKRTKKLALLSNRMIADLKRILKRCDISASRAISFKCPYEETSED
uniref:Uncharacterized protein n=1 Tax=Hyaloperonospora arabidopsidis (strain Emoy2) TaxID=559515 RepID=M4C3W7_HYAAE